MKKLLFVAALMICVAAFSLPVFAAGMSKVIDDFENNSDLKTPEWWKFDNVTVTVVKNPAFRKGDEVAQNCGKYSLKIKGSASDWYCGGMGTYLGVDATGYTGIQVSVFGYGEGNGKVRFELYDDDKGSWQTKYDEKWIPLKDDIWAYELNVNWKGWKDVYIPFTKFTIADPGRGDGIWNPDQQNGSGGLLQISLIFLAGAKDGEVSMNIDNLKLVTRAEDQD